MSTKWKLAQVVGPFVGILGARGMTIAAGSSRPRPLCPIHGNNYGACDGGTGCTRPR